MLPTAFFKRKSDIFVKKAEKVAIIAFQTLKLW